MPLVNPANPVYQQDFNDPDADIELDLLTLYCQLSNPGLFLFNPPVSPESVELTIAKNNILITDDQGNDLPLQSIPGQDSFSVMNTALIPPPLYSIRSGIKNLKWGAGIFAGTSGISVTPNEAFIQALSNKQVNAEENLRIDADFSSRMGLFEYVNLITRPVAVSEKINLEFAIRLFVYQVLLEANSWASSSFSFAENTTDSQFTTDFGAFYYYPGTGFGLGARFDSGIILTGENWLAGLSMLNIAGIQYSRGVELDLDSSQVRDNLYFPFRPFLLIYGSYTFKLDEDLIFIPVIDGGIGKSIFIHSAFDFFWKQFCFKAGIAYEGRWKTSAGLGVKKNHFLFETGISIQQSVFMRTIAGTFITLGYQR